MASAAQTRAKVRRQVAAIPASRPPAKAPPAPPPAPMQRSSYVDGDTAARPPFGGWLVRQPNARSEAGELLIKVAKNDPAFPKGGDPDEVRRYLGSRGADPDLFEAIDDAELDWLAY